MGIEKAIADKLLATVAVSAIVSTRGYALKFPENFNQTGFRVTSDEVETAHLRGKNTPKRARVQVDVVAPESSGMAAATALADAVNDALMGVAPFTSAGLKVSVVEHPARLKFFDAAELRMIRIVLEYIAWSSPA